jgi:hypothetical protein
MLERRKSKTEDPSYTPNSSVSRPKKRRKIEDATYRDISLSSESDDEVVSPILREPKAPSDHTAGSYHLQY